VKTYADIINAEHAEQSELRQWTPQSPSSMGMDVANLWGALPPDSSPQAGLLVDGVADASLPESADTREATEELRAVTGR
jgi:hypothetical protein